MDASRSPLPTIRLEHAPLLIGALFASLAFYYVSLAIYNLYFHPLRNYPGPFWARASLLWWVYHTVRGRRHLAVEAAHQKYGEVVRVTPVHLSFIGEDAWKDIYMHKQGRPQLKKAERPKPVNGYYSIINADDETHARQRKMLSNAFSDRALREQEPLFKTYIDQLMSNIRDDARNGRPVDVVSGFNYTTFDIIGDLSFNESFHNLELRRPHPWLVTVFSNIRTLSITNALKMLPGFTAFIETFSSILVPKRFQFLKHAADHVTKRIQQGSDRPDFMSKILPNMREDGKGISRGEVNATTVVLVIAGSETTATLLSGVVYLLIRNPRVLEKLRQEVWSAFESPDDINLIKVNQLPYLLAVLEEALRLYPPVPIALPRYTPPEGATICGHFVPGNMIAGIPQYVAYRSPRNFAEPVSFIPERWLPDRDPKFENDKRAVCQPFSAGPRNCLGKNLAYAEMKLIIARFIYEFEFEMVDKDYQWNKQRVFSLYEKLPLKLWIKEREIKK